MPPRIGFAEATHTPPFAQPLPSNREAYLRRASAFKLGWRRLRRTAYLALHGQLKLQRERIEPQHRRILFIHSGMPQVGDALMDLACRDLFKAHPGRHEVDLLINPHLVPLFAHDDVFRRVYGDPAAAARNEYDLAILLTASSHSLREKLQWFRALPFVHQIGFYNGPEFHRCLFGYYRLAQLLGLPADPAQVLPVACPHMVPGEAAVKAVDVLQLPPRFVVLAVGGVRGWRTYEHWPQVVQALPPELPVVLVGSANGRASADAIVAAADGRTVVDRVDRHPLPEVYEILRRSAAVACADGGLLHVANAARVPTVALFAERIDPSYRLTPANRSVAFHSPGEVSDAPPAEVAAALQRAAAGGVSGVEVVRVPEPAVRARPVDTVDKRLRQHGR